MPQKECKSVTNGFRTEDVNRAVLPSVKTREDVVRRSDQIRSEVLWGNYSLNEGEATSQRDV
jgi:hypothetical protein